ncbi:MAG: RadC family protein [Flavobacteriaceae bacterium]
MPKSNQKLSIKEWSEADRPRKKLLQFGSRHLSLAELLTVLIRSGTSKQSALDLSKSLLAAISNDLSQLERLTLTDLMSYDGIGEAKAASIVAALELGRRVQDAPNAELVKLSCSQDVFKLMRPLLSTLSHEEFWVLYLNRANKLVFKQCHSRGGMVGTVVDTRLILKTALDKTVLNLMLVHNHPSGQLHPSQGDKELTHKIQQAAKQLDLNVLDHIIIAQKDYFSFADQGIL